MGDDPIVSGLEVKSFFLIKGNPLKGTQDVTLDRRRQRSGPDKWAIHNLGQCLNRSGEWEWEPTPSSRDDTFINRCRFSSFAEALTFWRNRYE